MYFLIILMTCCLLSWIRQANPPRRRPELFEQLILDKCSPGYTLNYQRFEVPVVQQRRQKRQETQRKSQEQMLQELPRQPAQQLVWQRRTQEWGFQELQQQQKQLVWQLRLQERLLLALGATLAPGFEGQPRPGHAK